MVQSIVEGISSRKQVVRLLICIILKKRNVTRNEEGKGDIAKKNLPKNSNF